MDWSAKNCLIQTSVFLALLLGFDLTMANEFCSAKVDRGQTTEFACMGEVNKKDEWLYDLLKKVKSDPQVKAQVELDFFWDYLKDQHQQTGCEKDMLAAMDLMPDRGACAEDINGSIVEEAFQNMATSGNIQISPTAHKYQAEILDQMWAALPALSQSRSACQKASTQFERSKTEQARVRSTERRDLTPGEFQVLTAAQDEAESACAKYELGYSSIWSSESPVMRSYVEKWLDRFDSEPQLRGENGKQKFLETALPVNPRTGRIKNQGDIRWQDSFQTSVLRSMKCQSLHRHKTLSQHMGANGEPKPGTFTLQARTGKDLKEFLFKDRGHSAFAFMSRDKKYSHFTDELFCGYYESYSASAERREKVWFYTKTAVGTVLSSLSAVGWGGRAVAVASLVVDAGRATAELYDARKSCGLTENQVATLQSQPICQLFKPNHMNAHEVDLSVQNIKSKSCLTALAASAFLGGFAAKGTQDLSRAFATARFAVAEKAARERLKTEIASVHSRVNELSEKVRALTLQRRAWNSASHAERMTMPSIQKINEEYSQLTRLLKEAKDNQAELTKELLKSTKATD